MANKRKTGAMQESRAAAWMQRQGYRILERNFRCRFGEIDLIVTKDGCLVFTEVKYRKNGSCGTPQEAVDIRKQQRICNAASFYLYTHHFPPDTPCRFDVAAITGEGIHLIQDAFSYCGNFKI